MLAARFLDLDARGVALLGEVPQGLPSLGLPDVSRHDLNALLPMAMAGFVLAAVETSAIGRMFGQKHGNRFDANQELLALGAGNLLAGLGRGFPGERRHVAVARQRERRGPHAAVGSGRRGVHADRRALRVGTAAQSAAARARGDRARRRHGPGRTFARCGTSGDFSRAEFFVAIAALLGVLGSGPVNGVLLGAAISIVLLLRQAARPRVTELARVPGTTYFADRSRHPENEAIPGVLVVRCESALLYFNVEYVRERVFEILSSAGGRRPARRVLPRRRSEDRSRRRRAARGSAPDLRARGVEFRVADAHGEVRDALRRIGFEREHGILEPGRPSTSSYRAGSHRQVPHKRLAWATDRRSNHRLLPDNHVRPVRAGFAGPRLDEGPFARTLML